MVLTCKIVVGQLSANSGPSIEDIKPLCATRGVFVPPWPAPEINRATT